MNRTYKTRKSVYQGIIAIAAAFICLIAGNAVAENWNFTVPAQEIQPKDGVFQFPAADFDDGKAKYFVYKDANQQRIRFFIVKSSDGVIRSAFDACDVCFRGRKGYIQQGDQMICAKCGLKFQTDKINEVKGGCNPGPLPRVMKDGNVIITEQDVLAGIGYFK